LAKDKPPVLGLIQRGGEVVFRMLANVQQVTIKPIIEAAVTQGSYRLKQSAGRRRAAARAEQNQATTEIIDPDTGEITPA